MCQSRGVTQTGGVRDEAYYRRRRPGKVDLPGCHIAPARQDGLDSPPAPPAALCFLRAAPDLDRGDGGVRERTLLGQEVRGHGASGGAAAAVTGSPLRSPEQDGQRRCQGTAGGG